MLAGPEQRMLEAIRQFDYPAPSRDQHEEDRRPQGRTGRDEGSHRRPFPRLPDPTSWRRITPKLCAMRVTR